MSEESDKVWENFLNPEVTRNRLISAGLFIAAYELFEDRIIDRIKDFFCTGFNENGDVIHADYQTKVLSLNKSRLRASLQWLMDANVIDDIDLEIFWRINGYRHKFAHELFAIIGSEGLPVDYENRFLEMVALFRKIEVWWILNVDVPTNPDFYGEEIKESDIQPGPLVGIQLLLEVALGDEERSTYYYKRFLKDKWTGNPGESAS